MKELRKERKERLAEIMLQHGIERERNEPIGEGNDLKGQKWKSEKLLKR